MASTGVVEVVTFLLTVLQIMYASKSVSPLDTHPNIMLTAISTFLLYCFACYLQHFTSIFASSTWSVLVIYANFRNFLGFISIISLASIIFSTSSTTLAIVHLLSALFFSGKSVLSFIQNRKSVATRRSNSYTNFQVNSSTDPLSMAENGMVNVKSTVEGKIQFGRISENLDEEKGWALAKLGGELNAKKRRALPQKGIVISGVENGDVLQLHDSGIVTKLGFTQDNQMASSKGKSKMVGENLFNTNGLWSQEAIAAVEKGKNMNKKLGKMVLNLEDEVIENVLLADWLEKAIQDQFDKKEKDQHDLIPHAENKSQLEGISGCEIVEDEGHGCFVSTFILRGIFKELNSFSGFWLMSVVFAILFEMDVELVWFYVSWFICYVYVLALLQTAWYATQVVQATWCAGLLGVDTWLNGSTRSSCDFGELGFLLIVSLSMTNLYVFGWCISPKDDVVGKISCSWSEMLTTMGHSGASWEGCFEIVFSNWFAEKMPWAFDLKLVPVRIKLQCK
ncbi:hypothetical protein POM88_037524 [Heracleum sosnowskyi]|uniref:Transmembrane protein n=1 Tax=Heracleum sosnowskyi TaxID=360622 RepID=A0AAD8MFY0_9APIA|nr:hypothetical protein POM88_037524 [Heracleum sosnowskyi]